MQIDAFAVSEQGPRWSMEDTYVLLREADNISGAVFDGHSGPAVAVFAAETYPTLTDRDPMRSLREIHRASLHLSGGACAVAFRLQGDRLQVANVGDAGLAVVRAGAVELVTEEHRLGNPIERQRVLAAGALLDGPYVVNPRTQTGLMPTRSLGDHDFAEVGIVGEPYGWTGTFTAGWLVAACDGLWDVLDPSELPAYLERDVETAARNLAREALDTRGSWYNLTVLVVRKQPANG
jgi:serine/threonine protein phosphatase PrpC